MRTVRATDCPIKAAARLSVDDFGILGFAAKSSTDLIEALDRLGRYHRIWTGVETLETSHDTSGNLLVRLRASPAQGLGERVGRELDLAELVKILRDITGTQLPLKAAHFAHAAPSDITAHESYFRTRLVWEATYYGLSLDHRLVRQPLPKADAALASHFDIQLRELAEAFPPGESSLGTRLTVEIARSLPSGLPTIAHVARRLGVGERTLRRRLAAAQTSYSEVRDATRLKIAKAMLSSPENNLTEIAYFLGFSEPSAFFRAFKRWTGHTPQQFRQTALPRHH